MSDNAPKSPKYRVPPVEHRFQKGTSGNPKGRPRKLKASPAASGPGGGVFNRIQAMALAEAMLPVTVREGDQVEQIPAIQAVIRAAYRMAARNNSRALGHVMSLVSGAESARAASALDDMVSAVQRREEGLARLKEHRQRGLPPPELHPHPFDIIIDDETGVTLIDGPLTSEQAGAEAASADYAAAGFRRYLEIEQQLKSDPRNRALQRQMREHQHFKDHFDQRARRQLRHAALNRALFGEAEPIASTKRRSRRKSAPAGEASGPSRKGKS